MENRYTRIKPKCKKCGKEMKVDDIDYSFEGCQDNFWVCDCGCSAIEKIRYKKSVKIIWRD